MLSNSVYIWILLPGVNFSCAMICDFLINFSPSSICNRLWSPTTTPSTFSMVIFPSTLLVTHLVWQSRQPIKQTQWAAVTTTFLLTSVPPQCVPSPFTLTTHGFEWGLTSHALGPLILPSISFESLVMQCSLSKNESRLHFLWLSNNPYEGHKKSRDKSWYNI